MREITRIKHLGFFCAAATILFALNARAESKWGAGLELRRYSKDYREARKRFRSQCPGGSQALPVPSKVSEDLSIDVCRYQGDPKRLLILSSGIHGPEGFAGSAIQLDFMEMLKNIEDRPTILVIHALNPYGFETGRRVSENNVDLNRSFDTSKALFVTENKPYDKLFGFLNPQSKASPGFGTDVSFYWNAVQNIVKHGVAPLRQAILQGQYKHQRGVYFGGKVFEPQKSLVEPIIKKAISKKTVVLVIDLHTGYGERGKLHLFPDALPEDEEAKRVFEELFSGYEIDSGDKEDFYEVKGGFVGYVGKLVGPFQVFVPMVFEFGTNDNHEALAGMRTLKKVILENQGHHHGYVGERAESKVKKDFREMFYPADDEWKKKVITDSREILSKVIRRFMETDVETQTSAYP